MLKAKWFVFASFITAVPFLSVVSGCGGGSGGGVSQGVIQPSRFMGAAANGTVSKAGSNIGNVAFVVAPDGHLSGTLSSTVITGGAVRAASANGAPRAVAPVTVPGSGVVSSDGLFALSFDIRIGAQNGIVTFRGRLQGGNGAVTATNLVLDSPFTAFSGTYNLSVSPSVPNTGGSAAGTGSFTLANLNGSNAISSAIENGTASVSALKSGGKVTMLIVSFVQINSETLRTVNVFLGDGVNELRPGTVTAGRGAAVSYSETSTAEGVKNWLTGPEIAGSITLQTLTTTNAVIQVDGVLMTNSAPPGSTHPPTGTFTISGSGSAAIS